MGFLSTRRHDLTDSLKKLQCRTLIFVGESSQFHEDAIHMATKLDRRYCALVEVTCLEQKRMPSADRNTSGTKADAQMS